MVCSEERCYNSTNIQLVKVVGEEYVMGSEMGS